MRRVLLVHDCDGPSPDEMLPIWSSLSDLIVYVPQPDRLSVEEQAYLQNYCQQVIFDYDHWDRKSEQQTMERILHVTQQESIELVITYSDLYMIATARVAEIIGCRGPGIRSAQITGNKYLMRQVFDDYDVPSPQFRLVQTRDDLQEAIWQLGYPVMLKPTVGWSGIGVTRLDGEEDPLLLYDRAMEAWKSYDIPVGTDFSFLVEELMDGSTAEWEGHTDCSDQVLVEGMSIAGIYHPIAIVDELPRASGYLSPTLLSVSDQRRIFQVAQQAVQSIGVEYGGVHVELKLLHHDQIKVVGVGLGFARQTIISQIDQVYQLNLIATHAEVLLDGQSTHLSQTPYFSGAGGQGGAGTVFLYPSQYAAQLAQLELGSYWGIRSLETCLLPGVTIARHQERCHGTPLRLEQYEQPHWFANLLLLGSRPELLRASIEQIRSQAVLKRSR